MQIKRVEKKKKKKKQQQQEEEEEERAQWGTGPIGIEKPLNIGSQW